MNTKIFISYCWKNETEVEQIDQSFMQSGVELIRDKRDTEYKDSFKQFMKQIRTTDHVLMVISDEYLKSKNCMFEVLEVLKDENYKARIFPIVLDNGSSIYSLAGPLQYLKFWNNEYDILNTDLAQYPPDETISVIEDLRVLKSIRGSIVDFVKTISDLKNIPYSELLKRDFYEIKQKIGINLKKLNTTIHYEILKQEDVSHVGAKRYSANILIDSKLPKSDIKLAIQEITESLKESYYHRNKELQKHFKNDITDVIWLFIASRMSDIHSSNWICRTCWINSELSPEMRPNQLEGNDSIDDILIEWNHSYEEMANYYDSQFIGKDEFISTISQFLQEAKALVDPLIESFSKGLQTGKQVDFMIQYTKQKQKDMDSVYSKTNDMPIPPQDCTNLDELSQSYFAIAHNLFLYYSEKGLETWKVHNREYLMQQDIRTLQELEEKIRVELNI